MEQWTGTWNSKPTNSKARYFLSMFPSSPRKGGGRDSTETRSGGKEKGRGTSQRRSQMETMGKRTGTAGRRGWLDRGYIYCVIFYGICILGSSKTTHIYLYSSYEGDAKATCSHGGPIRGTEEETGRISSDSGHLVSSLVSSL